MTNKQIYASLCERENLPLFMQPWWMDAVCAGKHWDVLLYVDTDGRVQAAMPYLFRKRGILRYVIMPQLTQTGGVWLASSCVEDSDKRILIVDFFVKQLTALRLHYYYQQFPVGSPLPELLRGRGFEVRKRITYCIYDITDMDRVVASFSVNKRRQLKKAQTLFPDMTLDPQTFYRFHKQCLGQKRAVISYSWQLFEALYRAADNRNQGQLVALRDAENRLLAAAFVVWDRERMYYLLPALSPDATHTGAGARLVLECIRLARQKGIPVFDFEGSIVPSIANHYRQFGSVSAVYYSVEKIYKRWFRLVLRYNRFRNRKTGI